MLVNIKIAKRINKKNFSIYIYIRVYSDGRYRSKIGQPTGRGKINYNFLIGNDEFKIFSFRTRARAFRKVVRIPRIYLRSNISAVYVVFDIQRAPGGKFLFVITSFWTRVFPTNGSGNVLIKQILIRIKRRRASTNTRQYDDGKRTISVENRLAVDYIYIYINRG